MTLSNVLSFLQSQLLLQHYLLYCSYISSRTSAMHFTLYSLLFLLHVVIVVFKRFAKTYKNPFN